MKRLKILIFVLIASLCYCQNVWAGISPIVTLDSSTSLDSGSAFGDIGFFLWKWVGDSTKKTPRHTLHLQLGRLTATHTDTAGTLAGNIGLLSIGNLTAAIGGSMDSALTGGSTTSSPGNLTAQAASIMAISGQSVTASVGTLTGSASVAGSQNLAGNYVIASGGILSGVAAGNTSPSVLMSGNSVQAATGLFLPTVTQIMAITGDSESVTSSGGTLLGAAGTKSALTGNSVTSSIGAFIPVVYANIAISGQSVTSQRGTLTGSGNSTANVTLTGQSVTASYPSSWGSTTSVAYGLDTTQGVLTASVGTLTNSQNVSANLLTSGASGYLLLQSGAYYLLQDSSKYLLENPAVSVTASLGTLTATVLQSASSSLTGDSATSSVGTLAGSTVSSVSATLTGNSVTSSTGTLTSVASLYLLLQDNSKYLMENGTNKILLEQ